MISKRARRTSAPQENLRQFALNNSKGVNSTKAPTDGEVVYRASNLVVNHDGSMSLRKPIALVDNTVRAATVQQYYLYDNEHRLEVDGNTFKICDATGAPQPVKLTYTGYDGTELSMTYGEELGYIVPNLIFPQGTVEVVNLNSTTVLGNCKVDIAQFGETAIDAALYDNIEPLPRYIQIYYAETDSIWTMAVKPPEVNVLTTSEGEASFNPNLTLDNPSALRDVYDSVVPTIKGIVAYAASASENGKLVPSAPIFPQTATAISGVLNVSFGKLRIPIEQQRSYTNSKVLGSDTSVSATLETTLLQRSYDEILNKSGLLFNTNLSLSSENIPESALVYVILEFSINARPYVIVAGNETPSPLGWTSNIPTNRVYTAEELRNGVSISVSDTFTRLGVTSLESDVVVRVRCGIVASEVESLRVADITESVKDTRYRIATALEKGTSMPVILKAFCNFPNESATYYAMWFKSTDAIHWEPLDTFIASNGITVREVDPNWTPSEDVKVPAPDDYLSETYYPMSAKSELDTAFAIGSRFEYPSNSADVEVPAYVNYRIDTVFATPVNTSFTNTQYRFKVVAVEEISSDDPAWDSSESAPAVQYRVYATVAQKDYTPVFKSEFEFFDTEFENTVYGNKLYHKKALYSYGSKKFKNNIFVSDIDSFVTPLYNIIDLDTYAASSVTCLLPWRDYLVSATENAMYLHTKQPDGYLTKTVNTSVGISEKDAMCCKAVLNGILFKAGSKIYQLYPNIYAGDDSTLNLTEISAPIAEYLDEYEYSKHPEYTPFAFSTETEYILMLPENDVTLCLRYDYSAKIWTVCTYPVVFTAYKLLNLDNIRLFGIYNDTSAEYVFDAVCDEHVYGDLLPGSDTPVPIEFEWDTGQKTDGISLGKQFVESKLMFATVDDMEAFPMSLTVTVDGDPHITTIDVNTDAPFWKNSDDTRGVAGTAFRLSSDGDVGVLRQLVVRYSGKGRSIRHILSGSASSNFKMYETYVRYKILNTKK